jgi:hypothetical protein
LESGLKWTKTDLSLPEGSYQSVWLTVISVISFLLTFLQLAANFRFFSAVYSKTGRRDRAANQQLYGLEKPKRGGRAKLEVLRGMLGRTFPEEVLSRALYATQFTRHLDRHGYLKFKHWRFFGENGLAGEEVYENTLKGKHQATRPA